MFPYLISSPAWMAINHFLDEAVQDAVDSGSFRHCWLAPTYMNMKQPLNHTISSSWSSSGDP